MKIKNTISIFSSSKLIKESAYYTIFNMVEKIFPFLLLPFLTRILPAEDIGLYMLYQSLLEITLPLVTLNIDQSILINYYKLKLREFVNYFTNGIILFLPFFGFCFLLIYIFSDKINLLLDFPSQWFYVLLLIVFFRFFTQLHLNLLRVNHNVKKYGLFSCSISIINNITGLIIILNSNLGWKGLLVGQLVGYTIFGIISIFIFLKFKGIKIKINLEYILDIIKIGAPMSLHRIGIWLGSAVNRIIITSILGAIATGSYGIGATFATIVTLLEDAISKAFAPHLYKELKVNQDYNNIKVVKISIAFYFAIILISIFIYVFGYYSVNLIFGNQYSNTKILILPLVMASMFKGLYKLHVHYIFYTKKTLEVTKVTFLTGILNVPLSYYLVLNFGITGAAYSLLLISITQYIYIFHTANKLIPMPWFKTLKLVLKK